MTYSVTLHLVAVYALMVFTVYRMSLLMSRDTGPFGVFERLRKMYNPLYSQKGYTGKKTYIRSLANMIGEAADCPYCNGVWLSFVFSAFFYHFNGFAILTLGDAFTFYLFVIGTSGIQSFMIELSRS